jgi:hypothetical protein
LWVLALAGMGYAASVYYYGRRWERGDGRGLLAI